MVEEYSGGEAFRLTAQIVSAHVGNNALAISKLADVIATVHSTLIGLTAQPEQASRPNPAVPIKKSITYDFLICLEDGKKFKMLKRHQKNSL